jgi:ATP-dependent Clp protease protease subunit
MAVTPTGSSDKRYVKLFGAINEEKAEAFVESIISLNLDDSIKPILIIIDSYGGSVDAMWSMISAMEMSHAPLTTLCIGKAMSAGFGVFISGNKECRLISPHARLMMHSITGGQLGNASDLETYTGEIKRLQSQMNDMISTNTKMNKKFIEEKMKMDFYMNAKDAVKYGAADKIIRKLNNISFSLKGNSK